MPEEIEVPQPELPAEATEEQRDLMGKTLDFFDKNKAHLGFGVAGALMVGLAFPLGPIGVPVGFGFGVAASNLAKKMQG